MRPPKVVILPVLVLAAVSNEARAQTPVVLPETQQVLLHSQALNHDMAISVALPRGYEESDVEYPVVYVLDANLMFATVTESVRAMNITGDVPPAIVVGIGYPSGRFWNTLGVRALDLTPTQDLAWEDEQKRLYPDMPSPVGTGGAPDLIEFLVDEVIPFVEQGYQADSTDRILVGHSFGGLFALFTLFNHPHVFGRYLVSSPSLWWDGGTLFEDAAVYSSRQDRPPALVFLSVGTMEPSEFCSTAAG